MKYWEAMKSIDEGKKVRHKSWADGCFIYKDDLGNVVCADGEFYGEIFNYSFNDCHWEIYDDRKEVPQSLKNLFNALKDYLYDDFSCALEINDLANELLNRLRFLNEIYKIYEED